MQRDLPRGDVQLGVEIETAASTLTMPRRAFFLADPGTEQEALLDSSFTSILFFSVFRVCFDLYLGHLGALPRYVRGALIGLDGLQIAHVIKE